MHDLLGFQTTETVNWEVMLFTGMLGGRGRGSNQWFGPWPLPLDSWRKHPNKSGIVM